MRQIRRSVFETNSSSVHSLTMCSEDEFSRWERGEVFYKRWGRGFVPREEVFAKIRGEGQDPEMMSDNDIRELFDGELQTYDQFFDDDWFETYYQTHKTPGGETVVAFGYYGHD